MFGKVNRSLVVNRDLNDMFGVTLRRGNTDDVVLTSTLRCLMYERGVEMTVSSYHVGRIDPWDYFPQENELMVLLTYGETYERISRFMEEREGFVKVQKISDFYQSAFEVECWENEERKSTIVFARETSYEALHYLCVGIPAYLPWYFKDGLKDYEAKMLKSLTLNRPTEWESSIKEFLSRNNIDLREMRARKLLDGFESVVYEKDIESKERNLLRLDNDLQDYQNYIHNILNERRLLMATIAGLREKMREECSNEILELFLNNDKLIIDDVMDTKLTFEVLDYIKLFDDSYAKKCIKNDNSFLYKRGGAIKLEDMRKLYNALFVTRELKLRTVAKFQIDVSGRVYAIQGTQYFEDADNCYPNPHLHYYACMGDYTSAINQMLANGDNEQAIMTCVAAAQSLNFGDSTVMERFSSDMYRSEIECIETPTGEILTPKQAIVWLYDNHKEEEITNE